MALAISTAPTTHGIVRTLIVAPTVDEVVLWRDALLLSPGLHVHGVSTASEALHILEHGMFDVVLVAASSWEQDSALRELAAAHSLDFAILLLRDTEDGTSGGQPVSGVLTPALLVDPLDLALRITGVAQDLRVLRRRQTMVLWMEREARTDHLTGLYNRKAFDERLSHACDEARFLREPVSIILADIDGLRRINEYCGHSVGDTVIRRAAAAIARSIRGADFAARIGADDFGVILPGGDAELARRIARRVAHELDRVNAESGDETPEILLAFGLATGLERDAADLMEAAQAQVTSARPVRLPSVANLGYRPMGPDVA